MILLLLLLLLTVVQRANQCPVRTVHQTHPPLWKVDVPGLYQKEVQCRRCWTRGELGQSEHWVPNQNVEEGRQPAHETSNGEAGQERRQGMSEIKVQMGEPCWFEMNTLKGSILPAIGTWGDRSRSKQKEPGQIITFSKLDFSLLLPHNWPRKKKYGF